MTARECAVFLVWAVLHGCGPSTSPPTSRTNTPPSISGPQVAQAIANAGNDQTISTCVPTIVSGVKSTAETAGGTVTFQWSILSSPVGSAPKIRPVIAGDEREVVLVTDKDGDYVIGLVLIVTPTDGGDVTSSALDTVTVHARLPSGPLSVSYVDPSQIAVGSGATKLNVSGTNFACTSVIQVGGVALPTELGISGNKITALSASLPSSMLSTLALLPVTVSTGDQVSNALSVMTYAPLAANALLYEPTADALYAF